MERFPTGIEGLDAILGGGIFKGGIYIVAGRPGAGKTVLGSQLAFNAVSRGERAVYVTLLSETHDRLLANLRSFDFFQEREIGKSLFYLSGYDATEQQKLDGLLKFLRRAVRTHKAKLLVVDGMVMAETVAPSHFAYKKFIQDLQTWVGTFDCTAVLLTSVRDYQAIQPEHTMVDGIIEARVRHRGVRSVREVEVSKFRGSRFLEGRHTYRITEKGILVYPRAELLLEQFPPSNYAERSRCNTGIPGLDERIGGGFARGSTTLLLGSSGAGKTLFGLQFLDGGIDQEERGLYFGFFETPATLRAKSKRVGLRAGTSPLITTLWRPAAEQFLDELSHDLLEAVRREKVLRVFIDGLRGFAQSAAHPERVPSFLSVLTEELNSSGVTTVISEETPELFVRRVVAPIPGVSAVCQNIVFVRQIEEGAELVRAIAILKTRDSGHDHGIYRFEITDGGIRVGPRFDPRIKSILTGASGWLRTSTESRREKKGQKR